MSHVCDKCGTIIEDGHVCCPKCGDLFLKEFNIETGAAQAQVQTQQAEAKKLQSKEEAEKARIEAQSYVATDARVRALREKEREIDRYIRNTKRQERVAEMKPVFKFAGAVLVAALVLGAVWQFTSNSSQPDRSVAVNETHEDIPVVNDVEDTPNADDQVLQKEPKENTGMAMKSYMISYGYSISADYSSHDDYYLTEYEPELMQANHDNDRMLVLYDNECVVYDADLNKTFSEKNVVKASVSGRCDEFVYLTGSGELYKVDFHLCEKELLAEHVNTYYFRDDYSSNGVDYKIIYGTYKGKGTLEYLDGIGEHRVLLEQVAFPIGMYSDDTIYFSYGTDNGPVYSVSQYGSAKKLVLEDCKCIGSSRDTIILENTAGDIYYCSGGEPILCARADEDIKFALNEDGDFNYVIISEGCVYGYECHYGNKKDIFTYDKGDAVSVAVNKYGVIWLYTSENKLYFKKNLSFDEGLKLAYDNIEIKDGTLFLSELDSCYFITDDMLCCFGWTDNSYEIVDTDVEDFAFDEKRPNTVFYRTYDGVKHAAQAQWPVELEGEN